MTTTSSDIAHRRRAPLSVDALHADAAAPTPTSRSSCAAKARGSTTRTASATSTVSPGLFVSQVGHGRTELADAAAEQARKLAYFPVWSYAHPGAIELAGTARRPRARRSRARVLHDRRQRGGRVGVEARAPVLPGDRSTAPLQGDRPPHRVPRHDDGRAVDHRRARDQDAVRAARSRRGPRRRTRTRTGPRRSIPRRRSRSRSRWKDRRRVAAVFLEPVQNSGGCFPPHRGLLPARARDLRRDRRAARLRRGDLRVRPARPLVRFAALRLPARHHHDGEGHDVGLLPDRRHDRAPASRRAVPARPQDVPARHHVRRSSR